MIDTNTVLLEAVYNAALETRNKFSNPVFGLNTSDACDRVPWTSSNEFIRAFESQYDLTRKELTATTNKNSKTYQALSNQLVSLVETLCYLYSQLLEWINNSPNTNNNKQRNGAEVAGVYTERRGGWLRQIVEVGHKESALGIAEKFQIHRSSVEILVDDWKLASSSGNNQRAQEYLQRLDKYISYFGFDFASVLYQYLGETNQLKALLTLFPEYHQTYLKQFFSSKRYANISWAHDVELGNYFEAGKTLSEAASKTSDEFSSNKKLKLSLAKLNVLAGKENRQTFGVVDGSDALLNEIGSQIQVISIQEALEYQFAGGYNNDSIFNWVQERGTESLAKVVQRAHERLSQQRTLTVEELIDVLTLIGSDTRDARFNFYRALRLCKIAELTPERKAFNEKLIWRRLLLSDDWDSVMNTKKKSDEKVQKTTEKTLLYQTLESALAEDEQETINTDLVLNLESLIDIVPSGNEKILEERFPYASKELLQGIFDDLEKEKGLLKELIYQRELASWTKGIFTRVYTINGKGSLNKKLSDNTPPSLNVESMDVDDGEQMDTS